MNLSQRLNGRRRGAPLILYVASFLYCLFASTAAMAFGFNDVALRAKQLAAEPYKKPANNLPKELLNLTYDQYRDIRYNPEEAHWRKSKLPFELAFFHQGRNLEQSVRVNEITSKGAQEIKFDPALFNYGGNKIDPTKLRGLGFAGFRVHYPVNTPKYKDEVLVFLGASYFRSVGRGQLYGLSARAMAIDTALSSGEEFPQFVEFWVQRPDASAKELTIYGLLNSPRATGAYRFVLKPGVDTAMDVTSRLYLRDNVGKLGLAPLTSMFFFGENQPATIEDYRPEVHDSDGLSMHSSTGEWIWRPLINPRHLLVTSFSMTNPRGFGLMQRDRYFGHYQDLEARYDRRPSLWVQPKGQWGAGRVELVQIPVPDETNDNIVAYWVPDQPPKLKEPYDLEYQLLWRKDVDALPPSSWVTQTRRGRGYVRHADNSMEFTLDFEGPALKALPADANLEAVVTVDSNAQLLERNAYRNEVTGGWRVWMRLRRLDEKKAVELRAYLRGNNNVLSETWSYILPPA